MPHLFKFGGNIGALGALTLLSTTLSASTHRPPQSQSTRVAEQSPRTAPVGSSAPDPKAGSTQLKSVNAVKPDHLALQGKTVLIDPGHGGADPGAIVHGVQEKKVTLSIALKLRKKLESMGATVVMTRAIDKTVALPERRELSNRLCPDLFVSIHADASSNKSIAGIETYWYDNRDENLASLLLNKLSSLLHVNGKWSLARQLAVLHGNDVPASLIEVGYLSNTRTRELLVTEDYQDKMAAAMADTIKDYLTDSTTAQGCALSTPSNHIVDFHIHHGHFSGSVKAHLKGANHVRTQQSRRQSHSARHGAGKGRSSLRADAGRVGAKRAHVS